MSRSIGALAKDVHQLAKDKGWHTQQPGVTEREKLACYMMNIHSEVSELWESYRKAQLHEPCDKAAKMRELGLAPLTCLEEELADIVIRAMDTAEALGINLECAIEVKHEYNKSRQFRHGGKLA